MLVSSDDLRAEEADVVQAERAAEQRRRDREHAERHERAHAQALHGRARVLPGRAARRIGVRYVHVSFLCRLSVSSVDRDRRLEPEGAAPRATASGPGEAWRVARKF